MQSSGGRGPGSAAPAGGRRRRPGAWLALALALALTAACGPAPGGPAAHRPPAAPAASTLAAGIVSGQPAPAPAFPAVGVLLVVPRPPAARRGAAEVVCGATLVAPNVALTAAHCVRSLLPSRHLPHRIYFTLADDVVGWPAAEVGLMRAAYEVVTACLHPGFQDIDTSHLTGLGQTDDIALVELAAPPERAPTQAVVSGAHVGELRRGRQVTIVGYGADHGGERGVGSSGVRRTATSTITALGPFEMQIGDAGDAGRRCHGDSGGPTLLLPEGAAAGEDVVVGIGAHTYDEHQCLHGHVDTRLDRYLGWIERRLAEWTGR